MAVWDRAPRPTASRSKCLSSTYHLVFALRAQKNQIEKTTGNPSGLVGKNSDHPERS